MIKNVITILLLGFLFLPLTIMAEELNEENITGKWCFDSIEVSGNHEPEKRNYVFKEDGELLYQNSQYSGNMKSGKWSIADKKLSIRPQFIKDLEVTSFTNEKMVLKFFGNLHFTRGKCE